jgi:hypothetical protein
MLVSLKSSGGDMERTYVAGWEPTSRSCGRSKESHNGQSLGDLHDGGRECFRKLGTRLMAVDTWGPLVFCFWEMKTWEMLWGKGGQFEGFWIHAAFHTATVCLNLRWHYGQEVNLRPQEPKEADASGLSAGNMETSKSPA